MVKYSYLDQLFVPLIIVAKSRAQHETLNDNLIFLFALNDCVLFVDFILQNRGFTNEVFWQPTFPLCLPNTPVILCTPYTLSVLKYRKLKTKNVLCLTYDFINILAFNQLFLCLIMIIL